MKHLPLLFVAIFALAFASAATAQQNVKGAGALTCNEFFTIFEEAPEAEKGSVVSALFSWVQGYATGKNLDNPEEGQKDLATLDPEFVMTEVVRYCGVNGELRIYSIAEAIYQSLPAAVVDGTV
ncbi:MAG: HdeA/HdeB family chaperone [Pseudomonadota bacterium]